VFASGRSGWAVTEPDMPHRDLTPLFELILSHVPPPLADPDAPFAMLATTLDYDPYLGRVLTGLIHSGTARLNMPVKSLARDGRVIEQARLTKLQAFRGLDRRPIEEAQAGDIIAVAGLALTTVADTICAPEVERPLPADPIDPPTLAMTFSVNDSPLAGREGSKVTSRVIGERLFREAEGNVAIRVTQSAQKEAFEVAGRGELQLGVLIETMRREGYELAISRPRVLFTTDPATGRRLEPIEEVVIDVDEEFAGIVVDKLARRKAEMQEMRPSGGGKLRLTFFGPTRGLIGYQGEFLTDTRGTGAMSRLFHGYAPHKGPLEGRRNGVLVSTADGAAIAYALWNLEERGPMFIEPGVPIYEGMIIGAHTRGNDLDVNPAKGKQLTNIRTTSKDEAVRLTPPQVMTLEQAIAYVGDDELVEVTPKSIRLRKRLLDPNVRKRAARAAAAE
jgi:GTP-binding protein